MYKKQGTVSYWLERSWRKPASGAWHSSMDRVQPSVFHVHPTSAFGLSEEASLGLHVPVPPGQMIILFLFHDIVLWRLKQLASY